MEVELETTVSVSAEKLAKSMSFEEIASFLSEVALRFDQDFKHRAQLAKDFESGLSELGCRFLAEAVSNHFIRAM